MIVAKLKERGKNGNVITITAIDKDIKRIMRNHSGASVVSVEPYETYIEASISRLLSFNARMRENRINY